jgi:diketogulonate reductase-like aldo/keto reductase
VLASATLPIAVNQCNMSAGNEDVATINYCKSMNITYEGYGALQGGKMEDPRVMSIAAKYHVDPAEVLLRWVVQQGVVSVTASLVEAYDQQDVGIFDFALTAAEMAVLAAL